ncbi:unnamed protein product [Rotaria sp. Silwood2]|nr:unnamed protein product [Rotaria sp. Silwood2]CAF4598736.1 unnamed protein product [Rotaria sp. Silwood2]
MASSKTEKANAALRFADVGVLSKQMLAPIEGYENMPLVSLEEAVKPLVDIVPKVERNVFIVKQNCKEPKDGLTSDESASIMLYTFESMPHENSLYVILNATLRSIRRQKLIPWFLYLRLVLTALARLPSERRFVVRGVKEDLQVEYLKGNACVWWGFSSCTSSVEVLESENFFGKTGIRTLFQIDCHTGKDIKKHSFLKQEDEILLLPARQFQIMSCLDSGNGLHIIQLKEIEPPFPLLEPVPLPNPIVQPKKDSKVGSRANVDQVKNKSSEASKVIPQSKPSIKNKAVESKSTISKPSTSDNCNPVLEKKNTTEPGKAELTVKCTGSRDEDMDVAISYTLDDDKVRDTPLSICRCCYMSSDCYLPVALINQNMRHI